MLSILICYKLKEDTRKKNGAFEKAKHKWQRKTNGECTLAGLQCAAYKQLNICTFPILQEHQGPHLCFFCFVLFLGKQKLKQAMLQSCFLSFHIAIDTNLKSFPLPNPSHPVAPNVWTLRILLCHFFQMYLVLKRRVVESKWNILAYVSTLMLSFCSKTLEVY